MPAGMMYAFSRSGSGLARFFSSRSSRSCVWVRSTQHAAACRTPVSKICKLLDHDLSESSCPAGRSQLLSSSRLCDGRAPVGLFGRQGLSVSPWNATKSNPVELHWLLLASLIAGPFLSALAGSRLPPGCSKTHPLLLRTSCEEHAPSTHPEDESRGQRGALPRCRCRCASLRTWPRRCQKKTPSTWLTWLTRGSSPLACAGAAGRAWQVPGCPRSQVSNIPGVFGPPPTSQVSNIPSVFFSSVA